VLPPIHLLQSSIEANSEDPVKTQPVKDTLEGESDQTQKIESEPSQHFKTSQYETPEPPKSNVFTKIKNFVSQMYNDIKEANEEDFNQAGIGKKTFNNIRTVEKREDVFTKELVPIAGTEKDEDDMERELVREALSKGQGGGIMNNFFKESENAVATRKVWKYQPGFDLEKHRAYLKHEFLPSFFKALCAKDIFSLDPYLTEGSKSIANQMCSGSYGRSGIEDIGPIQGIYNLQTHNAVFMYLSEVELYQVLTESENPQFIYQVITQQLYTKKGEEAGKIQNIHWTMVFERRKEGWVVLEFQPVFGNKLLW